MAEPVIKNLPTKKIPGSPVFTGEFCQIKHSSSNLSNAEA
jgi:hypothetical protein